MPRRRFFEPTQPPPPPVDHHAELLASLARISTFNPPVQTCSTGWTFHGFYSGPTSIAYLFYRLSLIYPSLEFKSQSLLDWAFAYLSLGSPYLSGAYQRGRTLIDPDHCGVANETLCQLALTACINQDLSYGQCLCEHSTLINSPSQGSDEWLYGRSGYLYLLRLVRSAFSDSEHPQLHDILNKTITTTINRILSSPRPFTWHGSAYLGAVHGSSGILAQLVLSHPPPISPNTHSQLTTILTDLLTHQLPSGNFPSSLTSPRDSLVQFCHGSPGIIHVLHLIRNHFPSHQPQIATAIASSQPDLLHRGLLTKLPSLCHGIPTNAFALTSDSDFDTMLRYMSSDQLEANAEWMAEAGRDDSFAGLYTGEAGRAWMWAVAEQVAKGERMREEMGVIGFSDV